MKKTILVLAITLLTCQLSFAQAGSLIKPKVKKQQAPELMTKSVQGTIDAIVLADTTKKIKPEVSIKEDSGTIEKFSLAKTSIVDASSAHLTISQLKVGDKVKASYLMNKDGSRELKSLTVSK